MKTIPTVFALVVLASAATVGTVNAQSPNFMLSGLIVVEGGGRAWLQEPQLTQNQPVALRPGESIGPYRLTRILDDRVELVGPSGPFWVMLAGSPGPAVASSAPIPQPALPPPPVITDPSHRELPLTPPLVQLPPGTPRVDFADLLRGVFPQ